MTEASAVRVLAPDGVLPDILEPYARVDRTHRVGPCWVLANMVGGLDGSAAIRGRVGDLTDATDQLLFRSLRSLSDVVLVGAQTVRSEGYGPVRLSDAHRRARTDEGRAPVPALAVVSRSLDLDWDARVFRDAEPVARTMVLTCEASDAARRARAERVADVVVVGDDRVDLPAALDALAARGLRTVLCEGGPTLLGELAALDLLDELCLTLSPVLGGDALPISVTPAGAPVTRLHLASTLVEGETLYLRYERPPGQAG